MVDVVSPEVRSRMMAGIRSRDTKPELTVRRVLHAAGFRFRLSPKTLPGKPDLVLRKYNVIVFVHGCFWHGHAGCRLATTPSTRTDFWVEKIGANRTRDKNKEAQLRASGWRIAVIWECALKANEESSLLKLIDFIRSTQDFVEIGD